MAFMNYTITHGPDELRLTVTVPNIADAAMAIRALRKAQAESILVERDGAVIDSRLILGVSPPSGRLLQKSSVTRIRAAASSNRF